MTALRAPQDGDQGRSGESAVLRMLAADHSLCKASNVSAREPGRADKGRVEAMNLATNGRDFTKSAALLGVGAFAGVKLPMEAQASGGGSTAPALSSAGDPAPAANASPPVPLAPPDAQPPDLKVP